MKIRISEWLVVGTFVVACLIGGASAHAQFAQQGQKLVGTGAVGSSGQGYSVSLSGDGNTAIVGGPFDNPSFFGSRSGAVWVFTRSGEVWSPQQEIPSGFGNEFGFSVSLCADGNTAIIGAPLDVEDDAGYAAVYVRSSGVWIQQAILGDAFLYTNSGLLGGSSVSLSADGNTAIVGVPGAAIFNRFGYSPNTGAAVVSTRSAAAEWTKQAELVGTDVNGTFTNTYQGTSVSLSGDGNTAIVVGSLDGAVADWVFARTADGEWTQQAILVDGGSQAADFAGTFVSLSNDGNTAILGNASGAAVYARSTDGNWSRDATLAGTGTPMVKSPFGFGGAGDFSVSLSADGNTAMVGTSLYTRSEAGWTQQEIPAGAGAVGDAEQGFSVALSADGNTSIVGGPKDNNGAGAAWVYSELVFPGTPGTAACFGQRTRAIAKQYGGLVAASVALGFVSVHDLHEAIVAYCAEGEMAAVGLDRPRSPSGTTVPR